MQMYGSRGVWPHEFVLKISKLLWQQAEYGYAVRGSYEDFAVYDHWSDVLVAGAELVPAVAGLVAVVEFVQIRGAVGVQYCRAAVLDSPYDSVARAICRDAGRCPRISKAGGVCAVALVESFALVMVKAWMGLLTDP